MKVTLITGAASGLGRELSYLFARDGNHLLLIDIHIEGLKETKQLKKLIVLFMLTY